MSDSVPSNCPGTQSEGAGKASACAGCPNQKICSSGDLRVPDTSPIDVKENLLQVKNKIVVMSGKGGVGKSTVAVNLANAFCIQYPDSGVSLLDVDLCGPSIPKMTGTEGETMRVSGAGWSPVMAAENLSVVSIGYLLGGPDDAVIWRGPRKNGLIKQMLTEVDWCDQEWLIIDTPPGTSDEHLAVSELLSKAGISGIILVSTAQEVSLLDLRKEIAFCRKLGLRVLGLIENMSGFCCPTCHHYNDIFPPTTGGVLSLCEEMEINFLGKIMLDSSIGQSCDSGQLLDNDKAGPFIEISKKICKLLRV